MKVKMKYGSKTFRCCFMSILSKDFVEGDIPKTSKLMMRKTFVVSKQSVLKKYGTLSEKSYETYLSVFCKYFGCEKVST